MVKLLDIINLEERQRNRTRDPGQKRKVPDSKSTGERREKARNQRYEAGKMASKKNRSFKNNMHKLDDGPSTAIEVQ